MRVCSAPTRLRRPRALRETLSGPGSLACWTRRPSRQEAKDTLVPDGTRLGSRPWGVNHPREPRPCRDLRPVLHRASSESAGNRRGNPSAARRIGVRSTDRPDPIPRTSPQTALSVPPEDDRRPRILTNAVGGINAVNPLRLVGVVFAWVARASPSGMPPVPVRGLARAGGWVAANALNGPSLRSHPSSQASARGRWLLSAGPVYWVSCPSETRGLPVTAHPSARRRSLAAPADSHGAENNFVVCAHFGSQRWAQRRASAAADSAR